MEASDLSLHPNLDQIKRMLEKAFNKFPKTEGIILHSDQGWQYQHFYYRNELKRHGIIQAMSRKGNCYDNSIMETFFGRMKIELYYGYEKDYLLFENFNEAVEEYIDYYNNKRIQSKKMDASCTLQDNSHKFKLNIYVSRILGTHQTCSLFY